MQWKYTLYIKKKNKHRMISSLCPSLGLSPKMLESTCQIVSPPFKPVTKSKSTHIKGAQTDKGLLWASSWKHLGRHGQVNRERFWPMNHEGSLVHWLEFLYTHWLINPIITGPLKWCPAGLRPWTHGAAVFQSWMLQSGYKSSTPHSQIYHDIHGRNNRAMSCTCNKYCILQT